jgi:hypothetical protein
MAIKPSGSLSLSEINSEFGNGTNLNAYRGGSWFTVGSSGTFPSSNISINDFYSKRPFSPYTTVTSAQANRWAWGHSGYAIGTTGGNQTVRGAYYVSRQVLGATTLLDGYGNPYSGTGMSYPGGSVANSYDTISYTNPANYAIDVEIRVFVGRDTDDITRNLVYRGGSIASISSHSGGTLILDTGNTTGTFFRVVETIPAKTTYTWFNYCGIVNGSGGEGCTSWLQMNMLGRTGERVVSAQLDRWAWGRNDWPIGRFGGNQTVRGSYYISRQIYGSTTLNDAYGNPVAGTGLFYPGNSVSNSYDTITYTNPYPYAIQVEIEVSVGRSTDDITRNLVYRGGSIANISTHSGGTLILDTGNTTGTLFTATDTIPANTAYTYYNYCGIVNGTGGDGCTSSIRLRVL